MDKILTIVTRTCNRPNFFMRNYSSIKRQTSKQIVHMVLHHKEHFDYVPADCCNIDIESHIGVRAMLNLALYTLIDTTWFMVLDDDDYLENKYFVEDVLNLSESKSVVWFRTQTRGLVYPNKVPVGNVELNNITQCSYMAKTEEIKKLGVAWDTSDDDRTADDYRLISQWYPILSNRFWFNVVGGKNQDGPGYRRRNLGICQPPQYIDRRITLADIWA